MIDNQDNEGNIIFDNEEHNFPNKSIFGREEHLCPYQSSISEALKRRKNQCKHPKILIVDDEGTNIFALNLLLNKLGFKSDSANNG